MKSSKRSIAAWFAVVLVAAAALYWLERRPANGDSATAAARPGALAASAPRADEVELNDTQVRSIQIGTAATHAFAQQRTEVGAIDFNENLSVQVFAPYQGKIIKANADVGDFVHKGETLYTIGSPDLAQAESTLIAAAGVAELDAATLARAKDLNSNEGLAEKDLQQAVSDQQTADAALKAARDAVRIFGKTEPEIDTVVKQRRVDSVLVVRSPINGRVVARAAQPGLLVQPGNASAPFAIADVGTVWMNANVTESDSPLFHPGQQVRVKVMALPEREFQGRISVIAATVDPNTHTTVVRSAVSDLRHELRPGMLANFVIGTGEPIASPAVPADGVVREGDGTLSIWVTNDKRHFSRRTVQVGLRQDGVDQVTSGIDPGEQVVTKGAVLLSNLLNASPTE